MDAHKRLEGAAMVEALLMDGLVNTRDGDLENHNPKNLPPLSLQATTTTTTYRNHCNLNAFKFPNCKYTKTLFAPVTIIISLAITLTITAVIRGHYIVNP